VHCGIFILLLSKNIVLGKPGFASWNCKKLQKQNWTLIFLGGNSVFFWGTVILADDSTERLNNGNQIQRKMHVSFGSIEKNIYA
jgi:hypothetical protein